MMTLMHRSGVVALLALLSVSGLGACSGPESAVAAQAMQANPAATATVGDATLQASVMHVADLNNAIAKRYAINRSNPGLLLLITVRDADGNGIVPGNLRLETTAGALPDAPKKLDLRPTSTNGMTDYIGVFNARPPATVQFRVKAIRNGASAEISTNGELYSR